MATEDSLSTKSARQGMENIALIGFMGSGKSTVGPVLATRLEMDYVELDEAISEAAGMSIEDIFTMAGEEGFRELESKALRDVLLGKRMVIACGGGVVLREDNVRLLKNRCSVYLLRISRRKATERLCEGSGRPMLKGGGLEERVERLMEERAQAYAVAAHEVVEADDATPEEIAEEIATRWLRSE